MDSDTTEHTIPAQANKNHEPTVMDPHKLVLTIDGVEKSFHDWTLEYAERYFPRLEHSVYRVPPVQFNDPGRKVAYTEVCGQRCKLLPEAESSHAQGNLATRLVCEALEDLGHQLGSLAIVSNFQFENYLNKIETTPGFRLQKPRDKYNRGDVDVLALNVDSGPVVIEIKSVGYGVDWDENHEEKLDRVRLQLLGEVKGQGASEKKEKALDQVQKAKDVFEYIMNDLDPQPQAKMVVALPFVPRSIVNELSEEIAAHEKSAGVSFLCQDDLPESLAPRCLKTAPVHREASAKSGDQPSKLLVWWQENILSKKCPLSLDNLKAIMGRFCGLLSTMGIWSMTNARVEVRTQGEAVSETGKRFSAVVLTPQQLKVLQHEDDMAVGLRGPPGSGKTMLLALKGQYWVNQGHKVVIAAAQSLGGGVPSGFSLQKMIMDGAKKGTLPVDIIEVTLGKTFDRKPFDELIERLADTPNGLPRNHIHFLMDEFAYKHIVTQILDHLIKKQKVSVWWAMLHSSDLTDVEDYEYFHLDRAMRSPPPVQRLLKAVEWNADWQNSYTTSSEMKGLPTDGPPVVTVRHALHSNPTLLPAECTECADEIADFLIETLRVSEELPAAAPVVASYEGSAVYNPELPNGSRETVSSCRDAQAPTTADKKKAKKKGARKKQAKQTSAVKYEDILLLLQTPMSLCIKVADNLYQIKLAQFQKFWETISDGPFLKRLTERGLPVYAIPGAHPKDVAVPLSGKIGMTTDGVAWGLERTVIVYVASDILPDEKYQDPSVLEKAPGASSVDAESQSEAPQNQESQATDSKVPKITVTDSEKNSAQGLSKNGNNADCPNNEGSKTSDDKPVNGGKRKHSPEKELPQTVSASLEQDTSFDARHTDVGQEEFGERLLEMVQKLPKHHQQTLFVAASRTVSQLVLVVPATWEK